MVSSELKRCEKNDSMCYSYTVIFHHEEEPSFNLT